MVKTLVNLLTMLGLIVAMVVTFGLASISTSLTNAVLDWLGLSDVRWLAPVLHLLPVDLLGRCRLAALHVPVHGAARDPRAVAAWSDAGH